MTVKSVLKKLKLDNDGFDKIKQAVQNAEKNTSGEIVPCLAAESNDYGVWELFASIVSSAFVCSVMLIFSDKINIWLEKVTWANPSWHLPATFCIVAFVLIFIFFFVYNIPFFDNLIIPKTYKSMCVSKKAFEAFSQTGCYCTERHNGILIYVSYLEKQVRIIADKGISKEISDSMWQLIADDLTYDIKNDNAIEGFEKAISRCGELLQSKFPITKDDVNELPDGLLILEN